MVAIPSRHLEVTSAAAAAAAAAARTPQVTVTAAAAGVHAAGGGHSRVPSITVRLSLFICFYFSLLLLLLRSTAPKSVPKSHQKNVALFFSFFSFLIFSNRLFNNFFKWNKKGLT